LPSVVRDVQGFAALVDFLDVTNMHTRTFSSKVFVVLASLIVLSAARTAAADTINLMWDPNSEPEVTGYIVHAGTQSGTYTQHIDVGLATTYAFSTAVAGQRYCFAVSAYVAGPTEGPRSTEICGFSNQAPTLTQPANQVSALSQSATLQLQGSDPDGQAVTYSATGLPPGLSLMASTGFISGSPTAAGTHNVTVTVSDGVLTASRSFTWTVNASDSTAPTVTITGPTSATTYTTTGSTMTLSGSASDTVGVTQVTWVNSRGGSGTASGTASWSVASVSLQSGSNLITVTARDAAGNTSTDVVTVTYTVADTTAPAVTITTPTSAATFAATGSAVALGGTASDNAGVLQVTWSNSRGGSGTATGTTSWSVSSVALQTGSNVLTVTARDAAGNTASDVLTVTVNAAPALTNPGAWSNAVAQSLSLQLAGSDANGDTLSYTVNALPPGLALTASNGLIAGTPVMTGTYPVTATVSDGALTASQTFTWTITPNASVSTGTIRLTWNANTEPGIAGYFVHAGVQPGVYAQKIDAGLATTYTFANAVIGQRYCFTVSAYFTGPVEGLRSAEVCGYANTAPTLASVSNQSSNVGQAVSVQLAGSDAEGSPLTYSATGLPSGVSVAPGTGLISGAPTTAGTYSVTATVSDGALTASRSFSWTVVLVDTTAPVVTITGPTSAATLTTTATTITLSGTASDAVGVTQVTWSNNRGGSGTATGTTTWSTVAITLQGGVNTLTVTARDAAGNTSSDVLSVTSNVAPVLAVIANQTSNVGQAASLQLAGSDANNDTLSYGATGLPAGLSVSGATGLIAGIPTTAGSYSVTATVSDGTLSATRTFTWVIAPDTTVPVVSITGPTSADTFATTAAVLLLNGTASDNLSVTQVSWVNSRGGSGTATGTMAWTAAGITLLGGQNVITVTARDAAGNVASDVITVTRNVAPTIASISNQSTEVGVSASLQLNGSDADGDVITYGANGLPPGMALTVATGLISGTPSEAGTYVVTATLFDGAQSASQTFTWIVTPDATAPAVALTAPTTGATYASSTTNVTLSGTASDRVGVTQVTWVNNRGGSGVATGTTSWTSAVTLMSGSNVLTVTARDAAGNTSTVTLTVIVNVPPTLASVSNQSTEVGRSHSVQLSGSDLDGQPLTYSATGLPPGVTIGASGLVSGVPTTAGVYPVTATVFDGTHSASTTFTWTVTSDVTVPSVGITAPTSAGSYSTAVSTVNLGGVAADNIGVTQVNWSNDRGGSGVAGGTTSWNAAVVLQSGANLITITARDAAGNLATAVITVTFTVANTAPTLASVGTQSTRVGRWDSLQLVGADANGDTLVYTASGLPAGLSINAATGLISGVPTTVGSYSVTVRVSDGQLSRTRYFTWTVRRYGF
jgi:hypothetical protein